MPVGNTAIFGLNIFLKYNKLIYMKTLSICLIVMNEEGCIAECIESAMPIADEIIIYDTGSTDSTKEIAGSYPKVKVIEGEWRDDFAWARNQSLSHATSDFIMWLDADDLLDDVTRDTVNELKNDDFKGYSKIMMSYRTSPDSFNNRLRIFKRGCDVKWVGRIHEYLDHDWSTVLTLDDSKAHVIHNHVKPYSNRNLLIYKAMEERGDVFTIRDEFYYANELYDNGMHEDAAQRYISALSKDGLWYVDRLNACHRLYLIYLHLNDLDKALKYAYLGASCTSAPRADICCAIGNVYLQRGNLEWSRVWYERALGNVPQGLETTFYSNAHHSITPALQLCYIYDRMGDKTKAFDMHKLSERFNADHPSVRHNENYFKNIGMI